MEEAMLNHEIARTVVSRAALARMVLKQSDDAGMNACVACCDRWADGGQVGLDQVGLEWYSRDGSMSVRTFDAMRDDAARFANLLTARGVRPGDVVTGILPRGAEMLTVILGTWRAGRLRRWEPRSDGLWADVVYQADQGHDHIQTLPAERVRPRDVDVR